VDPLQRFHDFERIKRITNMTLCKMIEKTPTLTPDTSKILCDYIKDMKNSSKQLLFPFWFAFLPVCLLVLSRNAELYKEMRSRRFPLELYTKGEIFFLQINPKTKSWEILFESQRAPSQSLAEGQPEPQALNGLAGGQSDKAHFLKDLVSPSLDDSCHKVLRHLLDKQQTSFPWDLYLRCEISQSLKTVSFKTPSELK